MIRIPDEGEHETTVGVDMPLDILFEDDHFLIVNKPFGAASIPSKVHPRLSMANRVSVTINVKATWTKSSILSRDWIAIRPV